MKRSLAFLTVFLATIPSANAADDIDQINQLIQADFRRLSGDLAAHHPKSNDDDQSQYNRPMHSA